VIQPTGSVRFDNQNLGFNRSKFWVLHGFTIKSASSGTRIRTWPRKLGSSPTKHQDLTVENVEFTRRNTDFTMTNEYLSINHWEFHHHFNWD
jgi:hypothetical protein